MHELGRLVVEMKQRAGFILETLDNPSIELGQLLSPVF